MPNPSRWRRSGWCSAGQLEEISSKWHRVPNTASSYICHRVYQANLKDMAKAKAEPKAKAKAKASPDGSSAQGWSPQRAAVHEAPVIQSLAIRSRGEPCPSPAKRTRREAFLEECYHSELVCGLANEENLAEIEAMLGYAPKSKMRPPNRSG